MKCLNSATPDGNPNGVKKPEAKAKAKAKKTGK